MQRKYEIVYIFDSALEEPEVSEHLDRFHELLKTPEQPEPITGLAHWGKRTLAYPIKKKEVGYYVVAHFETDTTLLNEFERIIKLDEAVLRYLLVINEGLPATRIDHPDLDDSDESESDETPEADDETASEDDVSAGEAPEAEKKVSEPTDSTEEGGE